MKTHPYSLPLLDSRGNHFGDGNGSTFTARYMGFKWLLFVTSALLLGYKTHDHVSTRWLANPIKTTVAFLIIYGSRMHILFILKVKILVLY